MKYSALQLETSSGNLSTYNVSVILKPALQLFVEQKIFILF